MALFNKEYRDKHCPVCGSHRLRKVGTDLVRGKVVQKWQCVRGHVFNSRKA